MSSQRTQLAKAISKPSTPLSKIVNRYKFTAPYADEDKHFDGSLVLALTK